MAIANPPPVPARRAPQHALFDSLYRRHQRDVYRFTLGILRRPEDAEDATQAAFLNAYRALVSGDRPEKPLAWLLTIARHVCYRRFRTQAHRPLEVAFDPERAEVRTDDGPAAGEIRAALAQLSFPQRTVLVLRELGGLSYADIASTLGLSSPAVATLLSRGRRALREELEGAGLTPHTAAPKRRRRVAVTLPFERALAWVESWFERMELSAALVVGVAVVGAVGGTWFGTAAEPHRAAEPAQQSSRATTPLSGPVSPGVHGRDLLAPQDAALAGTRARPVGRDAPADPDAVAVQAPRAGSETASRQVAQTRAEPARVTLPTFAEPTVADAPDLSTIPLAPSLPPAPEVTVPSLPVPALPAPELPAPTLPAAPVPEAPPAPLPLEPLPPAPPLP